VTRVVCPMATAVGFSALAVCGADGAAAKITQLQNLHQDAGALLFKGGEGLRQRTPPFPTHKYVRIMPTKKKTALSLPEVAHLFIRYVDKYCR